MEFKADIMMKLDAELERGGKSQIDLLGFCVNRRRVDVLFYFLVREYRLFPTWLAAWVLYEEFCLENSAARLSVVTTDRDLPVSFVNSIAVIQQNLEAYFELPEDERVPLNRLPRPDRSLFDFWIERMKRHPAAPLDAAMRDYEARDAATSGAMDAHFLNEIWRPRVRPRLVAAGFWRIATIGG